MKRSSALLGVVVLLSISGMMLASEDPRRPHLIQPMSRHGFREFHNKLARVLKQAQQDFSSWIEHLEHQCLQLERENEVLRQDLRSKDEQLEHHLYCAKENEILKRELFSKTQQIAHFTTALSLSKERLSRRDKKIKNLQEKYSSDLYNPRSLKQRLSCQNDKSVGFYFSDDDDYNYNY